MAIFDFTADDLAQNRKGKISAAQIERIRAGQQRTRITVGITFGTTILVIAGIVGLQAAESGGWGTFLLVALPLALVAAAAFAYLIHTQRKTLQALTDAKVKVVRGVPHLSPRNKRAADHMSITDTHFVLTPSQYDALFAYHETHPDQRVHVYYVPALMQVLAVEPMS